MHFYTNLGMGVYLLQMVCLLASMIHHTLISIYIYSVTFYFDCNTTYIPVDLKNINSAFETFRSG